MLACVSAGLQDPAGIPPSPFDRLIELELGETDDPLPGRGPAAWIEYGAEFSGTLHAWTRGDIDLCLRIEDARTGKLLAEDDDSGGRPAPYIRLELETGRAIAIAAAAARPGEQGRIELCLRAAPEDEATRAAAERGSTALREAARARRDGDAETARTVLSQALERLLSTPGSETSERIGSTLWFLGFDANEAGDIPTARRALQAALARRERTLPERHPDLLRARRSFAVMLRLGGELQAARELLEPVVAEYERTLPEDHPDLRLARNNLASTLKLQGDLSAARAIEERVLESCARCLPQDHPDLIAAQLSFANTLFTLGDLPGARALQEHVIEACEGTYPEEHANMLLARMNLANTLFELGEADTARELQARVLSIRQRTLPEDHPELLQAFSALGQTMRELGDVAAARELQQRALAGLERTLPPGHLELLRARGNLADTLAQAGSRREAVALGERVLQDLEQILPVEHLFVLACRTNLAVSHCELGDLPAARRLLPAQIAGMTRRALAAQLVAPREAREALCVDTSSLAAALLIGDETDSATVAGMLALVETRRLVSIGSARTASLAMDDPGIGALTGKLFEKRSSLNDLVAGAARAQGVPDDVSRELLQLSAERDAIERAIRAELARRGHAGRPIGVPELARALPQRSIAVGFLRYPAWRLDAETGFVVDEGMDRLLAHVVRSDGSFARLELGPVGHLEELVLNWRSSLGVPDLRFLRGVAPDPPRSGPEQETQAGAALRERLLDPILSWAGSEPDLLFVCPDDLAFLVPFEALPRGSERVGDRLRIVSLSSFGSLVAPPLHPAGEPALLAVGNPSFDAPGASAARSAGSVAPIEATLRGGMPERFAPLLQTAFELEALEALFQRAFGRPARVLSGDQATKSALFEQTLGARYLHLATHGWFAPESVVSILDSKARGGGRRMSVEEAVKGFAPMTLCGLALAGANLGRDSLGRVPGILTAEELSSLDLSSCELAVLSACETNVGIRRAGQGIQSLQAALFAAGARTSITSLWKVDDAATRKLMERFYTHLWIEKLSKAEALRRAKTDLRTAGHPVRDWAGWVLCGDRG